MLWVPHVFSNMDPVCEVHICWMNEPIKDVSWLSGHRHKQGKLYGPQIVLEPPWNLWTNPHGTFHYILTLMGPTLTCWLGNNTLLISNKILFWVGTPNKHVELAKTKNLTMNNTSVRDIANKRYWHHYTQWILWHSTKKNWLQKFWRKTFPNYLKNCHLQLVHISGPILWSKELNLLADLGLNARLTSACLGPWDKVWQFQYLLKLEITLEIKFGIRTLSTRLVSPTGSRFFSANYALRMLIKLHSTTHTHPTRS